MSRAFHEMARAWCDARRDTSVTTALVRNTQKVSVTHLRAHTVPQVEYRTRWVDFAGPGSWAGPSLSVHRCNVSIRVHVRSPRNGHVSIEEAT